MFIELKSQKQLVPEKTFFLSCNQKKTFGAKLLIDTHQSVSNSTFSYCEQKAKFVSMEAKIMSNVPGWVAGKSVYHSERSASLSSLTHVCCLILPSVGFLTSRDRSARKPLLVGRGFNL
jgi:hypothetical protein